MHAPPQWATDPAAVYATFQDVLALSDRPEADITIPGWTRPDGTPLKWRVRALSLESEDAIHRAERKAVAARAKTDGTDLDGDTDYPTLACETLRRFLVVPQLTVQEAQAFRQRNPSIVRQLVDLAWGLTELDQEAINAMVARLTQPAPAAPDAAVDTAPAASAPAV
jgi:hypothetical protein